MDSEFDLVVIGSGPGGYVAAIRASQLGQKVAVVEESALGGICLNWGCIPTKALLHTAELMSSIAQADLFGLKVKKPEIEFTKVIQRSRDVAKQLSQGVQFLMKKNKITVVNGRARFAGKEGSLHKLEISKGNEKHTLRTKNVIIATGARARVLPGLEPDGQQVWTYREAMMPTELPKSLLVIGSGAIGIEFASFYNALGVDVTVVEIQDRILPIEDQEISNFARKAFEKKGIKIYTSSSLAGTEKSKKGISVQIKTPQETLSETFDKMIVAIGVMGNTEDLGLEYTKVQSEKNQIVTNEWGQTHEPGVYAIGDVAGAPWLAHKASHEGVMVAEKIAGHPTHTLNKRAVPGCTYSTPQVASIGLTEQKAKELGYEAKVGRFPFIGNGKAIVLGETEGFIKTIFNAQTGELLGAHMVGAEVTELVQGFAIAIAAEATEAELMQTIFPHPSLSEMMHEAVLDAFNRVIHV